MSAAGWWVALALLALGALGVWSDRVRTPGRSGPGWEALAWLLALLWPLAVLSDLGAPLVGRVRAWRAERRSLSRIRRRGGWRE